MRTSTIISFALVSVILTMLGYFIGSSLAGDFICYGLGGMAFLGLLYSIAIRSSAYVFAAGLIMLGALYYPWISAGFFAVKLSAAKEYVALVAPQLENYRQAHGGYPADLRERMEMPAPPFYLRYQIVEKGYEFRLPDRQSLSCDEYVYDNAAKAWWVDN